MCVLMRRLRLTKESCRARKRHVAQLQRDLKASKAAAACLNATLQQCTAEQEELRRQRSAADTSARQSATMHTEALERCAALEAQLAAAMHSEALERCAALEARLQQALEPLSDGRFEERMLARGNVIGAQGAERHAAATEHDGTLTSMDPETSTDGSR